MNNNFAVWPGENKEDYLKILDIDINDRFEINPILCACQYPECNFAIRLFVKKSVSDEERIIFQNDFIDWLTSIHNAKINYYFFDCKDKTLEYLHPKPV